MEKTILIVTEHDDVRRTLRKRLAMAFPHYLVIETAGEEAVTIVLSKLPRLVIIDMGVVFYLNSWFDPSLFLLNNVPCLMR